MRWTRRCKSERMQERLDSDYSDLADHYDELAAELADEIWLPLENEALLRFEEDLVPSWLADQPNQACSCPRGKLTTSSFPS